MMAAVRNSLFACLAVGEILTASAAAQSGRETRPGVVVPAPATPLVVCDPYFSIWSAGAKLADVDTTHWTGKPHRLSSLATIDGRAYRLMGLNPEATPALEQTSASIQSTQSSYEFAGGGVEIRLTFTTPTLPQDIDLLSRPITYVTYRIQSTDGAPHHVRLFFGASAELCVNTPDQPAVGDAVDHADFIALKMGSVAQNVLGRKGDDLRIDWGHLYVAPPKSPEPAIALGAPESLQKSFCDGQPFQESTRPTQDTPAGELAAAVAWDLPDVGDEPVHRWLVVAYDDLYSIEYMHQRLRPYWRRNGMEATGLLAEAIRDHDALLARCDAFDAELTHDLVAAGGEKYAAIATLAYRQCFGAGKFVADANGQPLQFCKENHSNGCIATSDVFYPMAPQFLLFGPTLTKSFLVPFMNYAASDRWKFPFAPHDLGTYPKANGQVYGGGERTEENQMPVEESGNLLLLLAALAQLEGNADFAGLYWPRVVAWAEYLKAEGFDPDNQLCTDDFAGHLAHNVNLSAKAICGLGAFAKLCDMRGERDMAAEYRRVAEEYAARWVAEADDGDHYRLTFDRSGTWSQKYNLVWDRLLGLNLFPDTVRRKEMDYYLRNQARYGLPLDSREKYTKLDWILWTATLTQERRDFEAIVEPVYRFLQETPDRSPMTDWFWTDSGRKRGFTARPVVGGVFLQALYDGGVWAKWSGREQTKAGRFAPMPRPPHVTMIVPAADTAPATWKFTTDQPADDWFASDFDDAAWREGTSGFGTRRTPGTFVGQRWRTSDIWLRRSFDLRESINDELSLYVYHDEDAEIYINGVLAAKCTGFNGQYDLMPIRPEARATLRSTGNVLAATCRQTTGGQYIDVGMATVRRQDATATSTTRSNPE
jgi:hypothetical protein